MLCLTALLVKAVRWSPLRRILRSMLPARRPRGLAAILFMDIVASTQVAAELGDRRWKQLLGQFRSIVRSHAKRYRGHEENTAGDGFFITFPLPADAVRAAVDIATSVQALGLDVRSGIHFGEAEEIEGQSGGMAVHVGARVMSLAGPAEILMTATVRDLIAGTKATTEDAGVHELKGVPGSWHVWRLVALDDAALPPPVAAQEAMAARSGVTAQTARRRMRRIAAVGAAVLAIGGGGVIAAAVLNGPPPPTMVKVDPATNTVTQEVSDDFRAEHFTNGLWAINGALWQAVNKGFTGLVRRDMHSGAVLQQIGVEGEPAAGTFGFGSIWVAGLSGPGSLDRWDAVSGKPVAHLELDATIASIDVTDTAVWVLGDKGALFKIDPIQNRVADTYDTPTVEPGVVVALGDDVWVCDCHFHRIVDFDPEHDRVVRTMRFSEAGYLVGLNDDEGHKTMWLLDPDGATLTPIDVVTGTASQPIGIGANLHAAAVAFGSLWVAAGDKLLRIKGDSPEVIARIPMPHGMSAGAIAADPDTGTLWIGNCGCPIE